MKLYTVRHSKAGLEGFYGGKGLDNSTEKPTARWVLNPFESVTWKTRGEAQEIRDQIQKGRVICLGDTAELREEL